MGSVDIPAKSIMLHQIVNGAQYSGAGSRVFNRFFQQVVVPSGGDLYLAVRTDNRVARDFYKRRGMRVIGTVVWAHRSIPGVIYVKECC